jgi:hypothetical protein
MDLAHYFETMKGKGVLATADDQGHVNVAVYGRPHVVDEDTIAFIMPDRLTHHNLQSNTHAAYLFIEEGPGYKGIRLFLSRVREEEDSELLRSIRRRTYTTEKEGEETTRYLVFFEVDKILPLIGPGKER